MTPDQAKIAIQIAERADIKGGDAPTVVKLMMALKAIAEGAVEMIPVEERELLRRDVTELTKANATMADKCEMLEKIEEIMGGGGSNSHRLRAVEAILNSPDAEEAPPDEPMSGE